MPEPFRPFEEHSFASRLANLEKRILEIEDALVKALLKRAITNTPPFLDEWTEPIRPFKKRSHHKKKS